MHNKRRGFFEVLRMDMHAMGISDTGFFSTTRAFFERTDFFAVFMYRVASALIRQGFVGRVGAFICWRINSVVSSCEIDSRAVIGEGFSLPHPVGVVIGRVIIGNNVEIYQNVTLGIRRRGYRHDSQKDSPVIGDNVQIYAGAVIAGGIKIGSNSRIAANSLVTADIPEGSTVVGVPGQIVTYKEEQSGEYRMLRAG